MLRRIAAAALPRDPSSPLWRIRRLPVVGSLVHALSHRLFPQGSRMWVSVRTGPAEGLELQLDPRFNGAIADGTYERVVQDALVRVARPGGVVYDIGAHLGFFSLLAARLVGADGLVVALEPDARNAAEVRSHVARNTIANVELVESAAWSDEGELAFEADRDHETLSYGRVSTTGTERVPGTTLDRLAASRRPPTVVKIDVEGGELDVLAGASDVLAQHHPAVLCEVHLEAGAAADRLGLVTALLERYGYRCEQLNPESDPTHVLAVHG